MNFFEHQDDARKKSASLVFLLVLAVIILIAVTGIMLAVFMYFMQANSSSVSAINSQNLGFAQHLLKVVTSETMLWLSAGVGLVVTMGSMFKASELRKGGAFVAESLGGRLLLHESADQIELRLLNIVEEMAIASGSPVPRVYVLDEEGINAFAAGTDISNAVIGVTRGCIHALNRDQLQGVIAHEFSHIYHGDMRLNMRLLAALHGILVIGLIGSFLVRATGHRRHYGSSRRKDGAQLALLGLGLMAIGFGGTFFGNMIKAAVSRQREYLADASAVQYTRNPKGIAGALYKIKMASYGSTLLPSNASEFSHFYFANGVSSFFAKLFATHPDLDLRIARVLPNGEYPLEKEISEGAKPTQEKPFKKSAATDSAEANISGFAPSEGKRAPVDAIECAGSILPEQLNASHILLTSLPEELRRACHTPYQARALIYALLLDKNQTIRDVQVKRLKARAHPATFREFTRIANQARTLPSHLKLPLLMLAQPALLALSAPQQAVFCENMDTLIRADKRVTVFEWSLRNIVLSGFRSAAQPGGFKALESLRSDAAKLLGFVARLGDARHHQASYSEGMQTIWRNDTSEVVLDTALSALDSALNNLRQLHPLQKPLLLKAVAKVAEHDQQYSEREKLVLRAIAMTLDCPLPLDAAYQE